MTEQIITLDTLKAGQSALVEAVEVQEPMRRRLQDLGLVAGTSVRCLQISPAGDPAAYLVRGAAIALRREDTCRILVRV